MLLNMEKRQQKKLGLVALVVIGVLTAFFLFLSEKVVETGFKKNETAKVDELTQALPTDEVHTVVLAKIKKQPSIDYKDLGTDAPLQVMMDNRKKELGIKKSLDMIVTSEETFTIGESTVSMQKILEKAFAGQGKIFQEELAESGSATPSKIRTYGIYVVQPGDNIWNIHFRILKDYYGAKGIRMEEMADEPGTSGMSSGVGKILKFSETMVIIYNILDEKVTLDMNTIDPLSKIIVYNLDAVFSLLDEINFDNVDRLQFDGKNIWIPVQKN